MKKFITLLAVSSSLLLSSSAMANTLDGKEFTKCFKKAFNEAVVETKEKYPKVKLCEKLSDKAFKNITLFNTGSDKYGNTGPLSAEVMGEDSIREYYENIVWEVECYDETSFLPVLFFKRLGQAASDLAGGHNKNDLQLVEDAMSIMLSRPMWSENGYDLLKENDLSYCEEN